MIYILLIAWMGESATSQAVEFNDLKSCQAAAKEASRQAPKYVTLTAICAAKGRP